VYAESGKSLCPPTCSAQIGIPFSPDEEWRQGLAKLADQCEANPNPNLGTNADLLDIIEGRAGCGDGAKGAGELGNEASCSGGMGDTSDCESDANHDPHAAQQGASPEDATVDDWLQSISRKELIQYVQYLEKEVCRLKLVCVLVEHPLALRFWLHFLVDICSMYTLSRPAFPVSGNMLCSLCAANRTTAITGARNTHRSG
jgi:hypothetical protein